MQKKHFRDVANRIFSKKWVRWLVGIAVIVLAVFLLVRLGGDAENFSAKYQGQDLSADVEGVSRNEITYSKYISLPQHKNAQDAHPAEPVALALNQFEVLTSAGSKDKNEDEIVRVYTEDGETVHYRETRTALVLGLPRDARTMD